MSQKGSGFEALAELLQDAISPADALSADIQGQISASLAAERISRNLTQKQFAKLLGIQQSQISRWESGDYNFTISTLAKYAAALNRKVTITLSSNEPAKKRESSKIIHMSDPTRMSVRSYRPHFNQAINVQEG